MPSAPWIARPERVYLYDDPAAPTLDIGVLGDYARETLGLRTSVRREFFTYHGGKDIEALAGQIAATKVRSIGQPWSPFEPIYGEVQFEKRMLEDPAKRAPGIFYDGLRLMRLCRDRLPKTERTLATAHLIFTSRVVGTWENDGRNHARVNVCGFPSLLSNTGIVEAPAKPKEYYILKRKLTNPIGVVPFEVPKAPFAGQFIDYDDPRLTEAMKGYVLQCLFHHVTAEPFCEDTTCRLFNAHWQAELLEAQLASGALCSRHSKLANALRAP